MTAHLLNTRNLDTTCDDVRLGRLSTHVVELRLYILRLAVIHLRQQVCHVGVHHRRKQFRMERRVAETLLQAVARRVVAARMDLGLAQLRLRRDVVPEGRLEESVDVHLEDDDEQNRRDGGDPVKGLERVLQTNGCGRRVSN